MTTASVLRLTDSFWICVQIYCDAFNSVWNDNKWIRISQRFVWWKKYAVKRNERNKMNSVLLLPFRRPNTQHIHREQIVHARQICTHTLAHMRTLPMSIYHRQKTVKKNDKININNIQNINFTSSLSGWPRARGERPCASSARALAQASARSLDAHRRLHFISLMKLLSIHSARCSSLIIAGICIFVRRRRRRCHVGILSTQAHIQTNTDSGRRWSEWTEGRLKWMSLRFSSKCDDVQNRWSELRMSKHLII